MGPDLSAARLHDDVLKALSGDRVRFLSLVSHWLGMAARGCYVEAGNDPIDASRKLRALNEAGIVVAAQLGRAVGVRDGYPDAVFLTVLREKAIGNDDAENWIVWAVQRALATE